MNEGRVAGRYAEAFRLSQREADPRVVYEAVRGFIPVYAQVEADARRVMANALISEGEKIAFLHAFTDRYCPLLSPLARLVVKHGRGDYFYRILLEIARLYASELGIVRVLVESAVPFDAEVLTEIERAVAARVEHQGIELSTRVLPELIGGFRLSIGDRLLDRSVQGALRTVARGLLGS